MSRQTKHENHQNALKPSAIQDYNRHMVHQPLPGVQLFSEDDLCTAELPLGIHGAAPSVSGEFVPLLSAPVLNISHYNDIDMPSMLGMQENVCISWF
jgi:hypothetical protein